MECNMNFNGWAISLTIFSFVSFCLNCWQKSNFEKSQAWMKEAEVLSTELMAGKDPYEHYEVKRRLDSTRNILILLAILIDIGILSLSFFAFAIALSAHNKKTLCSLHDT